MSPARSSRKRYQEFVQDYKHRRLDQVAEQDDGGQPGPEPKRPGARRAYLRDYMRWLRPHRYALGGVFVLALVVAGLQMIEPLFVRFIVDHVILNKDLDNHARLTRLNLTGLVFLTVVILSHVGGGFKDYRQRILNVRVILSLRRSLYERLLHLREGVHDAPDGIEEQEHVPLKGHDVADRRAADDVQIAAEPDDHDTDARFQQAP